MDEVRAFFNSSGPTKMIKLRGPLTGGVCLSKEDTTSNLSRKAEHVSSTLPHGTDYAKEVRERESHMYWKFEIERKNTESMSQGLESLEQLSTLGASTANVGEVSGEALMEIYKKYPFQRKEENNKLPINAFRNEIMDGMLGFPVLIIEGPTGCGKTTQVPQWILDDCYQNRRPCKIIVTQPRRIAAISIAKRVAQERGWEIGDLVGYQVGLENRTSADTRISYVTTGVLLQKLVGTKSMNEYTHVILDEVHERGQEMDFLLILVRKLLYTVSRKVKVILMSATFNTDLFVNYFTYTNSEPACCVKVEKREPMYSVKTFYLGNLCKFIEGNKMLNMKMNEPAILPEMNNVVVKLVNAFDKIDQQEDDINRSDSGLPSVLIFLPGIYEIEELYNCLTDSNLRAQLCPKDLLYSWWVLPLHSTITADEQVRVFQRAPVGNRKIILSTNIAESSITVPDIKYIIDYCLMKTLVADEQTNFTSLQLSWAAKTNCRQRAGRAGRVRDGRVYRLVPEAFYHELPEDNTPEIIRCPLERLVLLSKMLDMGPPSDILALAIDPPDLSNIHRTMLVLKEIGALKKCVSGEWAADDGDITYMGRVMGKLPLDVKVSKLIILGYVYGCLEETIIMAAAMSVKNVFNSPFRERLNAYNSKLTWADGSTSDCIALLNVYKVWNHLRQQNYFKQKGNSEASWARRFYLQTRALKEIDDMARELRGRLAREGIDGHKEKSPWSRTELPVVLKLIIAGAFYPQYFVQSSVEPQRERDAVRALGGLDPRNTVYLKNFPENQPGEVYATTIKNTVRQMIGDEPRVTFDKNSCKVFLTFDDAMYNMNSDKDKGGDPSIPGQVVLPVYKAIKARNLKMDIRIPLLPLDTANALAAMYASKASKQDLKTLVPRLPELDDTHIPVKICQLINVGNFWVQYNDESTSIELREVHNALNNRPLIANTDEVECGKLYAAPAGDFKKRAKVTKILPQGMVEVMYIDCGAVGRVSSSHLLSLPAGWRAVAPLALRCRLAQVAAAPLLDPHSHWSRAALNCFNQLVAKGSLIAKVYSVVHGVVAVQLLAEGGRVCVNSELLQRGLAVRCDEGYDSKLNHDLRESAYQLELGQKRAHNKEQLELAYEPLAHALAHSTRDCHTDICLKGPHSPLEATLHTLMYGSREKQVVVEWNSINSVLLDTDPQQSFERLLVAGNVGQNEMSSKLTLRHTTLMPNIRGLPAIVALLFCPVAELRRSSDLSRYVSALCGTGSHEDGSPYFPEHDLLVNFDVDIDVDDIRWINHIRHTTDYMLYCPEGQDQPTQDDAMRVQIPRIIRENVLNLLQKKRRLRAVESIPWAWEWRSVHADDVLELAESALALGADLFPLHAPTLLQPRAAAALRQLHQENEDLKVQVTRTSTNPKQELVCKLCDTGPLTVHAMRLHLYSTTHNEMEEDFRDFRT